MSHACDAVPRAEQQLMSVAQEPVGVPPLPLPPPLLLVLPMIPASSPHWLEHEPVAWEM